jgi:alkylation response protein AidB-like acyl-CoA dehydrogenase
MDFELSADQMTMRDRLRAFLLAECKPEYVRECDEQERYPRELFEKLAAGGWLGLPIAEEYGGAGGSCADICVFLEELAWHFEAAANIYYTSIIIAADALQHFGTEEQKKTLLPKLARGELRFAFSLSSRIRGPTRPRCARARSARAGSG